MLKPEWQLKKVYRKIEDDMESKRIIDVEFTEVKEEPEYGYGRKQIKCGNDEETV